jgi:hypothetical protein
MTLAMDKRHQIASAKTGESGQGGIGSSRLTGRDSLYSQEDKMRIDWLSGVASESRRCQ